MVHPGQNLVFAICIAKMNVDENFNLYTAFVFVYVYKVA